MMNDAYVRVSESGDADDDDVEEENVFETLLRLP